MRHVRISRFHLADLKGILEIEVAAFRRDAYPADAFVELYHEGPEFFLVAKSHRNIVGYVVAGVRCSNAEIVSIAVDPKRRKLGIGKALMMRTLTKLKASGILRVALAVRPANRAAMRLYSTLGFSRVRRISHYYADGGDALQMQKVLSVSQRPFCAPRLRYPAVARDSPARVAAAASISSGTAAGSPSRRP